MRTSRVLVTGTREDGPHCDEVARALFALWYHSGLPRNMTIVHGDCPTGIDAAADRVSRKLGGFTVEAHPADWEAWGKFAGPRRNQQMVNLGADLCLAFPRGVSRGTRHCIRAARAAGIPTRVVEL